MWYGYKQMLNVFGFLYIVIRIYWYWNSVKTNPTYSEKYSNEGIDMSHKYFREMKSI